MIRSATAAANASWPRPSAVPRLAAPSSSATADTSANTPSEIPTWLASPIAGRVRRRAAAHRLDHHAAGPLLEHVARGAGKRAARRVLERHVDHLGVAPHGLVDDRRSHVARAHERRADLQLVV